MSQLAPNLFDRRYSDLVQAGRSRLPSLAPAWTDHNAHDPGITLMELLAWVAEAQIYSLARSRRDERNAYAALMGMAPNGTRAARGLIWPDHGDPNSPSASVFRSFVIDRDAAIHTSKSDTPSFRPAHRIRWIPARIRALTTHLANGSTLNHTGANQRGGPAFRPFGNEGNRNDVLWMELEASGDSPLLPSGAPDDARLTIGIRADAALGGALAETGTAASGRHSPLDIVLSAGAARFPLRIVEDSTGGFMRTGVIVLDLSGVEADVKAMTLEFRAPRGFDRPPRILRVEPNVIPISQSLRVERELYDAQDVPDLSFDLETPGLEFEPGSDPLTVEVADGGAFVEWKKCQRLSDRGPLDRVYELDPVAARISFGNGINGQIPPAGAQIAVSYAVSEGAGGNTARNRKWAVHGLTGVFGVNPDSMMGGEDPSGWLEQRREARLAVMDAHALVSSADIEAAARALPVLEVGRAWVMPAQPSDLSTGRVRLIAMQARRAEGDAETVPETPRWLEAIRRALASRMPLGSRLVVAAPRYVVFTLRAHIEPEPTKNPAAVKKAVIDELAKRLTLVSQGPGKPERPFGLPVTRRDIAAWIQALPDVRRVPELQIVLADGKAADELKVPLQGLPRIDLAQSAIDVVRAAGGSR